MPIPLPASQSIGHGIAQSRFEHRPFFASAVCGLQNGMVSTYSGATIRTTHVSDMFTDLGTMLEARFRGHASDARKAFLYLLLILGLLASEPA